MRQNIARKCLVFEINAFEVVAGNSPNYDENTKDWQKMV